MYKRYLKRTFDFCASLAGLICASPILVTASILLYFMNDGGVIFTQKRVGHKCRIFKIYKFKTMNDRRDASGKLLPDTMRITKVGRFIRNSSIDELPQLLNVLKGDMSLIGPRPLLVEYLPLYNDEQIHRHDVRPGITGWAQVNGRNNTTWTQRFKHDTEYVENISFRLDCKIIWLTIMNIVRHKDIEDSTSKFTMEPFRGDN